MKKIKDDSDHHNTSYSPHFDNILYLLFKILEHWISKKIKKL